MNPDVLIIDYIEMMTRHAKSFRVMRVDTKTSNDNLEIAIWYDNVALRTATGTLECSSPEACRNRKISCVKGCVCTDKEVSDYILETALEAV